MKDWQQPQNVVHPTWNNGYQRYDLSIDEIIQKIIESGYDLNKIEDDSDIVDDETTNYRLEIHSTNGMVVSASLALVLSPRVYKNNEDITDKTDMKYFKWVRTSNDSIADAEWNLRHAVGIKDLYITHEDVKRRAIFHCAYLTGTSETNFVSNMYAAYMASINNKDGD
jgi:hypothetical protein